ncbi:TetR/AcrR family transcriptional regulator [Streptomyces sp. NPDC002490]|uniref:TetR/AcrR family transcriptional regulator n=1 Tax=Streptomyces sp. NPDC002490 TaxID=3154416 RepID=UPI00332A6FAF
MGHREDLLEGAKRCLLEKGFLGTTARDVVRESGTNLASIGYHYGSKDALLAQAYVELVEGVSTAFDAPGGEEDRTADGSLARFERSWENVIRTFAENAPTWRLGLEVMVHADRLPGVREHLARASGQARSGLVAMFLGGPEPEPADPLATTAGGFYSTLLQGLMVQWFFDPDTTPTAGELTEGLRRVMTAARDA